MPGQYEVVQDVIRRRKTAKILGRVDQSIQFSEATLRDGDQIVKQSVRDCGWAPFHYDRRHENLAEPWRVYWLDLAGCRRLAEKLPDLIRDLKPGNKMPGLLSGCSCLTLFTWIPQKIDSTVDQRKLERTNNEHLAATAAAVQNFLLLLTAAGVDTYWSSGSLIGDHLFHLLDISSDERIIAAIYASYPGGEGERELISGKQRERRSPDQKWFREISFGQE